MNHRNLYPKATADRGTTLTEMLVVVAVLSTGMMSVAGMLNDSINSLTNSLYHQRATSLSTSLAELLTGIPADLSTPTIVAANYYCELIQCEPGRLLAHELYQWQQQIQQQLPGGRGELGFIEESGQTTALIKLEWQTRGGTMAQFSMQTPIETPLQPLLEAP